MDLDKRIDEMKKDKSRIAAIGRRLDKIAGEKARLEQERADLEAKYQTPMGAGHTAPDAVGYATVTVNPD